MELKVPQALLRKRKICPHTRTTLKDWCDSENYVAFTELCLDCGKRTLYTLSDDYIPKFRELFPELEVKEGTSRVRRNQVKDD